MAAKPAAPIPAPAVAEPEPEKLSLKDLGLMSQAAVAELFKKSPRTIQRMEERGELPPAIDVGRTPYYRHESVLARFAERERKAAQQRQSRAPRRRRTGGGAR